jgi:predicted dehydrogenase
VDAAQSPHPHRTGRRRIRAHRRGDQCPADLSARFEYDPAHRLYDLAAGGGALLDLGIYPATFAWLFLGRPDTVQATGSRSPTGSDASVAVQWGYPDERFAQIASTTLGQNPLAGLIAGTEGWISVNGRVSRPTSITIHDATGDEVLPDTLPGRGYGPEVAEVERCLRAGELESPLVPLDETVAILEVLDGVREQLGVEYEADVQ